MAASSGDYRPLLSGGLWLAGSAAVFATLYGIGAGSSIAGALGFQYFLVAVATWAARDLDRKRALAASKANLEVAASVTANASPEDAEVIVPLDPVRVAVQTQATMLGGAAAIVGLFALLQLLQLSPTVNRIADDDTVFGIVCLAGAFIWLVLARSFQAIRETGFSLPQKGVRPLATVVATVGQIEHQTQREGVRPPVEAKPSSLPEAPPLMSAFREAQWATLIAAAGLIGASLEPLLVFWITRILLVWIAAICVETLLRLLATILVPADSHQVPVSPIHLLLREAIFTASNPVTSLIRTFENRCGMSLRSSWAIGFVKNLSLPLVIFLMLLCWALTSLAIVETNQMAVREHYGRVAGPPLLPGLHLVLPWPFGKIRAFPVKVVQQLPIGFVEADEMADPDQPRALLWTKPHAKEEFALVLGDGSELVAVNALVYFKISEDPAGFADFVYQQSSPEEALTAFAYRALMEQTRGRSLDDVLSANRAAFARRVRDSVRGQAKTARLGLEVVDFALLNLHPPIEAGGEYLEVINARLDARRRVTEADGEKDVALLDAQTRGALAVASARVNGSRRVAGALSEMAEFKAVGEAFQASPRTLRLRLWIEALENALTHQKLFLVDHTLLDEGGELLLDTRPQDAVRSPLLDAPSPFPSPGGNHND